MRRRSDDLILRLDRVLGQEMWLSVFLWPWMENVAAAEFTTLRELEARYSPPNWDAHGRVRRDVLKAREAFVAKVRQERQWREKLGGFWEELKENRDAAEAFEALVNRGADPELLADEIAIHRRSSAAPTSAGAGTGTARGLQRVRRVQQLQNLDATLRQAVRQAAGVAKWRGGGFRFESVAAQDMQVIEGLRQLWDRDRRRGRRNAVRIVDELQRHIAWTTGAFQHTLLSELLTYLGLPDHVAAADALRKRAKNHAASYAPGQWVRSQLPGHTMVGHAGRTRPATRATLAR